MSWIYVPSRTSKTVRSTRLLPYTVNFKRGLNNPLSNIATGLAYVARPAIDIPPS